MKKLLILPLLLFVWSITAQEPEPALPQSKIATASQTIQNQGYTIQVGVPIIGSGGTQGINQTDSDVRFPWSILYLPNTFSENSFDVSKGYFGDMIRISWILEANFNLVSNIAIFRREYTEDGSNPYIQIANTAPIATEYEDEFVEGGVLYEYKIEAQGIGGDEGRLLTFIDGIGYRSPTAIVTGSVNFEGGNPVQDVVIRATTQGGGNNDGTGLAIPSTGNLAITMPIGNSITTAATLQAFVKPQSPFTAGTAPIRLFSVTSSNPNEPVGAPIHTDLSVNAAADEMTISIGGNDYIITGFYPSGELVADGTDELIPISNFNTAFAHFTVQLTEGQIPALFINGRRLNAAYQAINSIAYPDFTITEPSGTITFMSGGTQLSWNTISIGGVTESLMDEIRVWKNNISEENIRTDYRRFINGNNTNLISYLRANEGVGAFAYDLSRTGFDYNNNHGVLYNRATAEVDKVTWVSGEGNVPTQEQLGVLGVTDENGNYEITAIPYSGTGESFNITPILGVHEFDPNQQLVFLGQGSEVVNSINFTDISSFDFSGVVMYDSRGIFPPIANQSIASPDIDEVGYNRYSIAGDPVSYRKGEYWLNDQGTPDTADDELDNYARIYSEGVNIYIDGEIVLDQNNIPVTSNEEGEFTISVPIGNHFISIGKPNHVFEFEGRFPADSGQLREFFEDSNQAEVFIDNTRLSVTGRVVGGSLEAAKPIGFGAEGPEVLNYTDEDGFPQNFEVSSTNNIGVSTGRFAYSPPGSVPPGSSTINTRVPFETNTDTGEYRVEVLPLNYTIDELNITNNDDGIILLSQPENVNLFNIPELIVPEVLVPDGTIVLGEPYHLEKSVIHRSTPILSVIGQSSETSIDLDLDGDGVEEEVSTDGFAVPIYRQFLPYDIELKRFERYTNYDGSEPVDTEDPIVDGELLITNNLALENSEIFEVDVEDASIIHYQFKGGLPVISPPFVRSISINYRIQGIDYSAENVLTDGIILGGASDGSQSFLTAAPDIPDLILRDPPGSGSSATIESGESVSFIKSTSSSASNNLSASVNVLTGVKVETGGGLAGPVIESQSTNEATLGIGLTTSSENGETVQKTYTFSQSISTSSETDFVGSEGDLYIGQSVNYAYGSYDDVYPRTTPIPGETEALTNSEGQTIHIGKQKSVYFNEEPSETFYVLSQKTILEITIPELQNVITNIMNDPTIVGVDGIQPLSYYQQQVYLWRKTILENELSKYRSLNNPEQYRTDLISNIQTEFDAINSTITTVQMAISDLLASIPTSPAAGPVNFKISQLEKRLAILELKKVDITDLFTLINDGFSENISFDAGVGDFTRTVETTIAVEKSTSFTLEVDEAFEAQLGVALNGVGLIGKIEGSYTDSDTSTLGQNSESSTAISYTFNDPDPDNLLSVDVINLFDGQGPVFSTVGGRTSCPYEGAELALFYDPANYDPEAEIVEELPENVIVPLSVATQRVEVPIINVETASVTNIPESQNAEFVLLLENNSATETDASFVLRVDNTTNPNNALINIEPNGTIVNVPYGQQVPYALTLGKSVSDVFDYQDIRILLESFCDGEDVSDEVFISATFVPSCSSVEVTAPSENWVFNRDVAYNLDGTSNALPISMSGYNLTFGSFEKIVLEYRSATAPTWVRLFSYYTTPAFLTAAQDAGETDNDLIDGPISNYLFDIDGLSLSDGAYEIRARSSCINGTEFISPSILGLVDLTAPRRFNTPSPQDGILSSGDDIKASFNEDILYNTALSQISITGRTNQLPINNSVSVRYDGVNNTTSIEEPDVMNGDFSLEFWMLNETTAGTATILAQEEGLDISLTGNDLFFTIADVTVMGAVPIDGLFHHYTFTHDATLGSVSMYIDDIVTQQVTGLGTLQFTNDNNIIIGGNTFVGNIHDMRLWSKPLTLADAFANLYTDYSGNERNLIGYWPMDEGRGTTVADLARSNNMNMDAAWDIKPKGESYLFESGQYQTLDNVNFVQLNDEQDATISFWVKTDTGQNSTIFSNGRGDGTDLEQPNGVTNKWAINMALDGTLNFNSEGTVYPMTTTSVADDAWHHVVLLLNRNGNMRTVLDGNEVSANPTAGIGGFSGNRIWLGARGQTDQFGMFTVDQEFNGQLDEFRLWNSLRNAEQTSRDQYMEVDPFSIGLLLYARMNEPDPITGAGPTYFHAFSNNTTITSEAVLNVGAVNYDTDVPTIKPEREVLSFPVNRVINGDEMIISPVVSDPASIEGQILDITVHRMFDAAGNSQESPITWTAFVQKNDVRWFAPGFNDVIEIIKEEGEDASFDITIVNQGGQNQPYTIDNIPSWLDIPNAAGTLTPSSTITLTASINNTIGAGDYVEDLFLVTDFGLDQKLQLDVKVLAIDPVWAVNPNDYQYSMNIIGKVNVDGAFSGDVFDKVGAFVDGAARGEANLVYNAGYEEYFVFLTLYSNLSAGENVTFRIWDASQGSVLPATIDGDAGLVFSENAVLGSLSDPAIFENTGTYIQNMSLNPGWTWISFNVNDNDFQDIDELTTDLSLVTSDRILSSSPDEQFIELYYEDPGNPDNSGWDGTISSNGGLNSNQMFKVFTATQQPLTIEGPAVDIEALIFDVQVGWNWLPYPFNSNHSVNEALSTLELSDGDVIKSQTQFAVYDPLNGWSGSLTTLNGGRGYMIRSAIAQDFSYPTFLNRSATFEDTTRDQLQLDNFAAYNSNMNIVVQLPEGYDTVYAYNEEGTLRGVSKVSEDSSDNISYLTTYGDGDEALTFYAGNSVEQRETINAFHFINDGVNGSREQPVILSFGLADVQIFPNPFQDQINLRFGLEHTQTVTVSISNMIGQIVHTQKLEVQAGVQQHTLCVQLASGAYTMQIDLDETTKIEKIIKN